MTTTIHDEIRRVQRREKNVWQAEYVPGTFEIRAPRGVASFIDRALDERGGGSVYLMVDVTSIDGKVIDTI